MNYRDDLTRDCGSNSLPSAAPWFVGYLTKTRLQSLPKHCYLVSNVAHNPFNPVMELEITEDVSREALWCMIVDWRLNGRTFAVFLDERSFQENKDARLKAARSLIKVQQQG
jgi:hypothetical protein